MKVNKMIRAHGVKAVLAVGATLGMSSAFAAGLATDMSSALTNLNSVSGDISSIGWACLGILIVAAGFKYLRRVV